MITVRLPSRASPRARAPRCESHDFWEDIFSLEFSEVPTKRETSREQSTSERQYRVQATLLLHNNYYSLSMFRSISRSRSSRVGGRRAFRTGERIRPSRSTLSSWFRDSRSLSSSFSLSSVAILARSASNRRCSSSARRRMFSLSRPAATSAATLSSSAPRMN